MLCGGISRMNESVEGLSLLGLLDAVGARTTILSAQTWFPGVASSVARAPRRCSESRAER
jgi:hypothetical protein